jgi:ubiquinone/menaquinone biosynthesis C-methylase UbiE
LSVSFDRAADFYDATRGYPADVQERIGKALLDAAGATHESRILEMGVGTGRIALPIIRAGYRYTGVDISSRMLEKLRAALRTIPGAEQRVTVVEGDITALPFADRRFDVVMTVHVYHLVADRLRAMAEGVRVLARPGVVLNGRDDIVDGDHHGTDAALAATWRDILASLGWHAPSTEDRAAASPLDEWRRLGAEVDTFVGVEWETRHAPAQDIEQLAQRVWSRTWSVPDHIYPEAIRHLRDWAAHHYGDALERPLPRRQRFIIERARFS